MKQRLVIGLLGIATLGVAGWVLVHSEPAKDPYKIQMAPLLAGMELDRRCLDLKSSVVECKIDEHLQGVGQTYESSVTFDERDRYEVFNRRGRSKDFASLGAGRPTVFKFSYFEPSRVHVLRSKKSVGTLRTRVRGISCDFGEKPFCGGDGKQYEFDATLRKLVVRSESKAGMRQRFAQYTFDEYGNHVEHVVATANIFGGGSGWDHFRDHTTFARDGVSETETHLYIGADYRNKKTTVEKLRRKVAFVPTGRVGRSTVTTITTINSRDEHGNPKTATITQNDKRWQVSYRYVYR